MQNLAHLLAPKICGKGLLVPLLLLTLTTITTNATTTESNNSKAGRELAHSPAKGNCLACHTVPKDLTAITLANIAPPLILMRERFPDRKTLRMYIWDPTSQKPNTIMPPFGKHKILTIDEIDLIIDYLYTM